MLLASWALGCGPGTVNTSGDGSGGESSGEMESIEEWFPGYYFPGTEFGGVNGGGVADFLSAFEFRTDHTVHDLNVFCDGRPDEIRLVHDWRVSDQGTVEIVLREPLAPGGGVGDVYQEVFIENPPCGPHLVKSSTGLERSYFAGRYCPENFRPGTGQGDHDWCDFVPCDERARTCAEEAANAD